MLTEHAGVLHADDVELIVLIFIPQVLADVEFHLGLMAEFLLVPDNFDCDELPSHVIFAFESLAEGAFAKEIQDFVPISEVVSQNNGVITLVVIVALIMWLSRLCVDFLLGIDRAKEVDRIVTETFSFFAISHFPRL